jgi:hypothetical protein
MLQFQEIGQLGTKKKKGSKTGNFTKSLDQSFQDGKGFYK